MNIPGTTIISPLAVYTDWFPRGGDNLIIQLDVVQLQGATLKVQVVTRSADSTGDGTALGTASSFTSIGRQEVKVASSDTAGLSDLVRLKIEVTGTAGSTWAHYRILDMIWYDTPNA